MRKCVRCGEEMEENFSIGTGVGGHGVWIRSENSIYGEGSVKPKVAICPKCGELSIYVEDINKLKK